MTSLALMLAQDSRGPAALYMTTDSRITFFTAGRPYWDTGQKTFASPRTADIFAFCGDAFFPPTILRQLLDLISCQMIFSKELSAESRNAIVASLVKRSIDESGKVPMGPFSVFHGARDHEFMRSVFRVWDIHYEKDKRTVTSKEIDIASDKSCIVKIDGTGGVFLLKNQKQWENSDADNTSRSIMWNFCNTLHEGKDPYSGGSPQMVGIWRKGIAQNFGFWWKGAAYLSGLSVPDEADVSKINWFNHRFERCSGQSGERLPGAKRHAKPKRLR